MSEEGQDDPQLFTEWVYFVIADRATASRVLTAAPR